MPRIRRPHRRTAGSRTSPARALTAFVAATAAAVGLGVLATPTTAGAAAGEDVAQPGRYVVTLAAMPLGAYDGGAGFERTRPTAGERLDASSAAVQAYRDQLLKRQQQILDSIGDPEVLYQYTTVLDGFAAELSGLQVQRLRADPSVVAVEPDSISRLDADRVSMGGLPGGRDAWQAVGGPADAGDGTVVGLVDSGVWPDSASLSGAPLPAAGPGAALPGFTGTCDAAERWSEHDCNEKLVAARWFVAGFGQDNVAQAEYLSPRDVQGHGTHTASVVAGNHNVSMVVDGETIGANSGVAPGARVAVYKACWAAPDPADDGCATTDALKALDQAVLDGVDVVNFPLSGPAQGSVAVRAAFANATAAGVFVATSAGNDGPGRGTVTPSSPWVTTAAASTHRLYQGALVLGDGERLIGAMMSDRRVPQETLVRGRDIGAANASERAAAQCRAGSLDATAATGKVVICERGGVARVDKSRTVKLAGGVAMVLVNTVQRDVFPDFHAVPTVHLDAEGWHRLQRYLDRSGPTAAAALDPNGHDDTRVPALADFSGRGPADGSQPALKPDVTAPGVNILGAVPPVPGSGRMWDATSGTSVAAAHVSGLAAMIQAAHPSWSPMAIRSALLTTADDVTGAGMFAEGSGLVDPLRALDPGLVFDADPAEGTAANQPTMVVRDLVGATAIRRTVTNVSDRAETYTADVSGLGQVDATVRPATFRLRPGQSRTLRIRLVAGAGVPFDRPVTGHLAWHGSRGHEVRSAVVVTADELTAPPEARGIGSTGAVRLTGRSGFTGNLDVSVAGLVGSSTRTLVLERAAAFDPQDPIPTEGARLREYDVPAGTAAVRFDLDSVRDGGEDLDLYVYRDGVLVESATDRGADARVTMLRPEPGTYQVFAVASALDRSAFTLARFTGWVVPREDTDTLDLARDRIEVRGGQAFTLRATWTRLNTGLRWFGVVRFGGADGELTPVSVD